MQSLRILALCLLVSCSKSNSNPTATTKTDPAAAGTAAAQTENATGKEAARPPGEETGKTETPDPANQTGKPLALCTELARVSGEPIDVAGFTQAPAENEEAPAKEPALAVLPRHSKVKDDMKIQFAEWIDENRLIVVRNGCREETCAAQVFAVDRDGANFKIARSMDLDETHNKFIKEWEDFSGYWRSLEMTSFKVADLIGDRNKELWVLYKHVDDPEAAVGSQTHDLLALFSLPDLDAIWKGEIGDYGEGSTIPGCSFALHPTDVSCDGATDLVVAQVCGAIDCIAPEKEDWCAEVPEAQERHQWKGLLWDPATKTLVEAPTPPAEPAKGDKPAKGKKKKHSQ